MILLNNLLSVGKENSFPFLLYIKINIKNLLIFKYMANTQRQITFYRVAELPKYANAHIGSFYFVYDGENNSLNLLWLAGPQHYENYSGHSLWADDDLSWDSSIDEPTTPDTSSTPGSGTQVDLSNYYTKPEVDDISANIHEWVNSNYYTKTEVDNISTNIHNWVNSSYYNKLEVDDISANIHEWVNSSYYNKPEVDDISANIHEWVNSSYYTKTEVDNISTNIHNWVNSNYYTKKVVDAIDKNIRGWVNSSYYNKREVDNISTNIHNWVNSNYYTKTEVDGIDTNIRDWANGEFLPLAGTTVPTSTMSGGIGFDLSVDSLIYSVNANDEKRSVLTYNYNSSILTIGSTENDIAKDKITEQININANRVVINGEVRGNSFYEISDIRCKEIKGNLDIDKCYGVLEKCQDIIYNLKGKTQLEIGLIAQEVEQFFPEVVKEINGVKTLAYDRLVVICFKLMKDMVARIEKLENK